ncbi:MAG: response regulator transcription factor [Planctomycetes bacterium]|nr:response regulator transcription factor [Planctomycetota bacterium]
MLVVEDDPSTADALRRYLEHEGHAVDVAGDGLAALDLLRTRPPDAVLLDLMLPGLGGLEICRRLRETSDVPVLMLTARTREDEIVRGLDAGADDYVVKPFRPREVVARVRALLRRRVGDAARASDDELLAAGTLRLDPRTHTVTRAGREIVLTPTEFALLETFLRHPDRVLSRARLIELALGRGYDGLERTLDTHVLNLRRKLDDDPRRARVLETVVGVGYRLRGDAP